MTYDWLSYYKSAYEKQKRKNTVLAGQVADAENQQEFLAEKLQRIYNNPCYKMTKPFRMGKRLLHHVKTPSGNVNVSGHEEEKKKLHDKYMEKLQLQKDSYGQWILQNENITDRRAADENITDDIKNGIGKDEIQCKILSYDKEFVPGEFSERTILLFAEHPEYLDKEAKQYVVDYFRKNPSAKILYGAEDQILDGKRIKPWFKPCWSPDTLLSFFYFGSYFAVELTAVQSMNREMPGQTDYKQRIYEFVLQLTKPFWEQDGGAVCVTDRVLYHAPVVHHAPVLYHAPADKAQVDEEQDAYFLTSGETKKEDHPEFWGYEKCYLDIKKVFLKTWMDTQTGAGATVGIDVECYQTFDPDVWTVVPKSVCEKMISVVIPSKDHPELLKQCISSFLEKTDPEYTTKERLEFVIVDNGSCSEKKAEIEAEIEAFRLETEVGITYLYEPMEFNFSAMCNKGVKASRGEYVLLLNDDIEILEKNWLKVMLGQALLPGTGAVGAKLWYPDGERIQHAGITNMHIGPSHKLVTFPDDRSYYYGHNSLPYDMIAVTAACLLVRKDIYLEVGGLDETMKVAYNDVDFCFKLYEAGYRNVQRNDAVLCHHESVSRGLDEDSEEKWDRLLSEKSRLYEKHPGLKNFDPYYSEQLADNAPDYRIGYLHPFEQPFLTATPVWEKDLSFLQAHESNRVMLTVERAGKQNKLHQEEPDIFFIEGWCYMLGGENSQYERWVILENEDGYARLNVQERNRPDVTAILPKEKDIELAGFTCRILKEDLINCNNLRVGMLYRNVLDGKYYYRRGDKFISK